MPRTLPVGRARPGKPVRRPVEEPGVRVRAWPAAGALVTTFVLGVAVAFGIGALATRPSSAERSIAELKQADAQRDTAQIASLTELARGSRDRLAPVLLGMAQAVPVGTNPTAGPVPSADAVRGW